MNFPLFKFEPLLSGGFEQSLIVALIIGIVFGFVLERAGFGSCRKLAAQFYFKDLAVFKVMFTAIVTAMVGVYLLSVFGVLDINLIYKTPTILMPQVIGGLLLGIGFVIGGYCPGTSVAALGTGKIDAFVFLAGVMGGLIAYGEVFPSIQSWAKPEGAPTITLDTLTGIPYGILVFAFILMAAGGFLAAEWAEGKLSGAPQGNQPLLGKGPLVNTSRIVMAGLLGLGFISLFLGSPYGKTKVSMDTAELARITATGHDKISAEKIADDYLAGLGDYKIIDIRSAQAFATYHLPESENMHVNSDEFNDIERNENIVIYSDDAEATAKVWFILKARGYKSVRTLDGGLKSWMDNVLYPSKPVDTSKAAQEAFAKRAVVAERLGGEAQGADGSTKTIRKAPTPPPAPAAGGAPKKKKRKAREGC